MSTLTVIIKYYTVSTEPKPLVSKTVQPSGHPNCHIFHVSLQQYESLLHVMILYCHKHKWQINNISLHILRLCESVALCHVPFVEQDLGLMAWHQF